MRRNTTKKDHAAHDPPPRRRLPILLRRAWYGLNQAFRRRISHTGVTPDQFTVMRWLAESDAKGMVQSELTREMASDPNTVASLLERMETAGLIERRSHESDARAYRIRLVASGWAKFEEVREIALRLQAEIQESLPPERREAFLEDLATLADACQAVALKGGKKKRPASERPAAD